MTKVIRRENVGSIILVKSAIFIIYAAVFVSMARPAFGNHFERSFISEDVLYVDNPIATDLEQIRKHKIRFVHVSSVAPSSIFDTPKLFPNLQRVALVCAAETNECMLHSLAENYPNLEELTISQTKPLIRDSLAAIKRFRKLRYLDLDCELGDEKLFAQSVSTSVIELKLSSTKASTWKFPYLPSLRSLTIWNAPISANFLDSLQAPKLNDIYLDDGVNKDAYPALARLKHLRKLILGKTIVDKDDFDMLKKLGLKTLVCGHN